MKKITLLEAQGGSGGDPLPISRSQLEIIYSGNRTATHSAAFADNYADTFDDVLKGGRCAVFVGKPGTGKTHLAVGIGLRIMHRDSCSALFTTVLRAIRRIKDTWSRNSNETERQAVAAMTFPDLLILDEVGVQIGSETEKLFLFDLLNERYEKRYPTIFISNLTVEEVKVYLGECIADRLRENSGEFVTFDWEP
ncbi:ATP-binding protein [Candidatus Nitrotoga sp. 1052]|uniref:ATP-binding protein n=1 Tax=Candidatus Nitrotoga sp. 1052 TaxID=2886964 RepID=UPI001EF6EA36|nr:ATP-binding protein [Candidatus Nitrotoga sp. 1052]